MRKQLMCGVAAIAITAAIGGTSLAADRPVWKAPPPVLVDWSGFYVGGHLGYGGGAFDTVPHEGATGANTNKPSGLVGGMHVGQNWQVNTFVYGWEADLSATGWSKTSGDGFGTTGRLITHSVGLLASLRGRIGITFDRTLIYVTGGLAYTQAEFLAKSPGGTTWTGKFNNFGGVLGLGAEWKQTQNFSWRLEALWYIFSAARTTAATSHDIGWRTEFKDALVVRLGATHHF